MEHSERLRHLVQMYDMLRAVAGESGMIRFSDLRSTDVPGHGVYFLFEPGEERSDSGEGPRIVRVGTHALTETSKATLWGRLRQHRGTDRSQGGNHRGSIFRLLIGDAMLRRDSHQLASWGIGANAPRDIRDSEIQHERAVSAYLAKMFAVVIGVADRIERALLETSAIALVSNFGKDPIDPPSSTWLGRYSSREKVRKSGLWNNRDVDAEFDPKAFNVLMRSI